MSLNIICIYIGGTLSLLMAVFHLKFYKRFGWKDDLAKITYRNRRIFYTIHLALLLLFVVFAYLSFFYNGELSRSTGLGFGINAGISLFWFWRTLWQIFYFRPKKNSKMPAVHYILIVVFLLLFAAYFIPLLSNSMI
ncbi:MAG: hypothetical protein GY863_04815 [bacterium]|nr:hypothetical protein [bacterium]